MTLTETIKETEKMTKEEFKALFFYMLKTAITKYKKFHFLEDFMTGENPIREYDFEKESNKVLKQKNKRIWKSKGQIDLKGELDDVNIRDYIYDE